MEKITVVIVTHQSEKDIKTCLLSVKRAIKTNQVEIVVVDSGSLDNTVQIVKKEFSEMKIIRLRNVGFASAANAGAAMANGTIIFFLNPDTQVPEDTFEKLNDVFGDKNINLLGCNLVHDEKPEIYQVLPFPDFGRTIWNHLFGVKKNIPEKLSKCDWVSGGAFAVRKNIFDKVGGFSENFFLYFEDVDLCKKVKKLGEDVWFDPDIKVNHFRGGSSGDDFRMKAYDQSQFIYFLTNRSLVETILLIIFRFFLREHKKIIIGIFSVIMLVASMASLGMLKTLAIVLLFSIFSFYIASPSLGIIILCLSLFVGQTVRIPVLTSFINLSDVSLALFIVASLARIVFEKNFISLLKQVLKGWWILLALIPGIMFSFVRIPTSDFLITISYALRILAVLSLVPIIRTLGIRYRIIEHSLIIVGLLTAFVGLIQLVFLPNLPPTEINIFSKFLLTFSQGGWDPHHFRLFSTWLDPNFIAEFFVMMTLIILVILERLIHLKKMSPSFFGCLLGIIIFLSVLVLTQSRSGLVALVCSLIVFWFMGKVRRLLIPLVSISIILLILFPSLYLRLFTSPSNDPTTQLRLNSVNQAINHFEKFPVWGLGYNAYGVEQTFSGNINQNINSKAGTDNSLFLLAATLGIWGMVILTFGFANILGKIVKLSVLGHENALVFLLVFTSLIVHSQFVQSLTYIHLIIPATLLFSTIVLDDSESLSVEKRCT